MKAFAIAAFLCFGATLALGVDDLTVTIQSGQIKGAARPAGGAEFLGIPYAQPPLGDLRWREPQPAKAWSEVRDATKFGAACAQRDLGGWNRHDVENGKEDCLFLNVMTPKWPAKEKLAVMVWLHGGGNEGGSASSDLYKDGTLVQHGVILVTVNYRLGIFGFMAQRGLEQESPHHASGNYGLLDQILALHWVPRQHREIRRRSRQRNAIRAVRRSARQQLVDGVASGEGIVSARDSGEWLGVELSAASAGRGGSGERQGSREFERTRRGRN
jgi:para-nitrobenzyl esterase